MNAGRSTFRSRFSLGAVLILAGALGLSSAAAATGPNGFAGKWSTIAGGKAQGSLTLDVVSASTGVAQLQGFGGQACPEPTTYYYGNYSNFTETGVISGCAVTPNHLVGRFRSNTKPQPGHTAYGDGDISLVDPTDFSGHLTYEGASYTYTGTADNGSGGTPPPTGSPPPSTGPPPAGGPPANPGGGPSSTPTGSSPGSSTPASTAATPGPSGGYPISKIQASLGGLAPGRGTVIVAEPLPGASVTVTSPNPLAASALTTQFTVADSLGDFPGSTIVGPGEVQRRPSGPTIACWLIGPDAVGVPPTAYGRTIDLKFFAGRLNASQPYTSCAALARSLAATTTAHPVAAKATQAPSGCTARRVGVSILTRNGLVTAARPVAIPAAGQLSVKYTCARSPAGSLKITVSSPRRGGLTGALGTPLRLGIVRAANAHARTATLAFSFGTPRPTTRVGPPGRR